MSAASHDVSALWGALMGAPIAVVVLDADGRVHLANDAALSRWPALVLGCPFTTLLGEGEAIPALTLFDRVRAGRVRDTLRLGNRPGAVPFDLACMPAADGSGALLLVATDIHAQQELEGSRRAREGASDEMSVVAQLAGGVAHDINNALAVIVPNAESLAEQLAPGTELRSQADEIAGVALHARHVVTQLMALGRRQPANARPVDLAQLVAASTPLLSRVVGADIRVVASPAESPALASVDPGHVEQILVNLVVNASEAMPAGGAVRLEATHRRLSSALAATLGVAPGAYVAIEVADEGHGIAPAVLPRIFEPFFTTRDGGEHAGLGLAAVLGLARQASGAVTVESSPLGGTLFSVLFPRLDAEEAAVPSSSSGVEGARRVVGSPHLLLVDDEANVRSALSRLLRRHGFRVSLAAGGVEALELIRSEPSLVAVLSDIVMPDMNGVALTREIQARRPELPVVLMSGYTSEGVEVLEALAVPFLQKPFSGAEVVGTLLDAMENGRARAAILGGSGAPPAADAPESGVVTDSVHRTGIRRS